MRLVCVAGIPGSGKTSVIRSSSQGKRFAFIANSPESMEQMRDVAEKVDFYPFKTPCARIRQFSYRVDLNRFDDIPVMVSEPPGGCLEQSSPMLNLIYATQPGSYELGPLITVIDGRTITNPISKRTTEGLRMFRMVDESDVVCVTFSDSLDDDARKSITEAVGSINDSCEVVFFSPSEGSGRMSELIFGDARYSRPLE